MKDLQNRRGIGESDLHCGSEKFMDNPTQGTGRLPKKEIVIVRRASVERGIPVAQVTPGAAV
ncbi:MAG: hypothetical protein WD295_00790, partial [Bacteroidota bacterium]